MGTADFILSITESWITPKLLPLIIFFSAGVIAFSTGTSWGTFGIMMPIAVPIAFSLSGGVVNPMVLATISAVAGGGVFGDHCSPLSDTTILSSMGAASDHIDHVKTQIPYALTAAGLAMVIYIGTGFIGG
jgi:Na+/H+ antiporter NhaC